MTVTRITTVLQPATPAFSGGGAYDLVSLDDVKLELQIGNTASDAWLRKVITRASLAIQRHCSRTFQPQLYQDLFWAQRDAFPWQLPGGVEPLQLGAWPLITPQWVAPPDQIAAVPPLPGTAPPLAPSLSSTGGGALPAARYYVRATYVTPEGETAGSLEANLAVPAGSLLTVASPAADTFDVATGWNVYAAAAAWQETLQTSTPLALGASWTLPASGLLTGLAPPPSSPSIVVNVLPTVPPSLSTGSVLPQPLCEGVDFETDAEVGQLTRLFALSGEPSRWTTLPTAIVYQAGYPELPDDLQEACLLLVKMRWFARSRDPMIREENAAGVWQATYWGGTGPGGVGDMPADVTDKIERFRVPVLA
jgi:hypothetical protein